MVFAASHNRCLADVGVRAYHYVLIVIWAAMCYVISRVNNCLCL